MLFRELSNGWLAIPQPSHAWLAGQLIRTWGNAEFGTITPLEEATLAAEQHDIGWMLWEQKPTLNSNTGRPYSFRELAVSAHTAIWQQGTAMARVFGRYPALLVSLHGTGLYAAFDAGAASRTDAAIVRTFLNEQEDIQRRLTEDLRADHRYAAFANPHLIERNRRLIRAVDRMSIAICTAMQDPAIQEGDPTAASGIIRDVPTAAGTCDLRMHLVDGDPDVIQVTPWPFMDRAVGVVCEGILLPPVGFTSETEMQASMQAARPITVEAMLQPG